MYRPPLQAAERSFSQAIKLNPSDDVSYLMRAKCRQHLNRLDAAATDYTTVIHLDPTLPDGFTGRGEIRATSQRPQGRPG